MVSPIQTLPLEVVHAIAAGEVIDSLAAVVRELVDNSLDAGATRIDVGVWPDRLQVRVSDNGRGMTRRDLQAVAHPHSTSKIRQGADLWAIGSLGFRGEALYSLAQVGRLEICSRSAQEESLQGWRKIYGLGEDPQGEPEPWPMAPGTVVRVWDLFGQWPVRRQGLPSPAQQLRSVQRLIQGMALCHPGVTWRVEHSDRPWFNVRPAPEPLGILTQILREVQATDLQGWSHGVMPPDGDRANPPTQPLPHSPTDPLPSQIIGVLGLPDRCHRRRPDWVKIAVNGRVVQIPELEQTLMGVFRQTLPRDRFPVAFVHLCIPPSHIDWNRHPAKAEIYLRHLDFWREQVRESMGAALKLQATEPTQGLQTQRVQQLLKAAERQGVYGVSPQPRFSLLNSLDSPDFDPLLPSPLSNSQNPANFSDSLKDSPFPNAPDLAQALKDAPAPYAPLSSPLSPSFPHPPQGLNYSHSLSYSHSLDFSPPDDRPASPLPSPASPLRAMAQLHQMYIVAEHSSGIWIVEQHIAHERVLYEQIEDCWEPVPLDPPLVLSHLGEKQVEQLRRIELIVEEFGQSLWAVRSLPGLLVGRSDCREAVLELSLGGDLSAAQATTACRSAIRNGQPLTLSAMQTLLDQWHRTRHPHTCPHGRPICLPLEETQLAQFFRRHWTIAKS